MTDQAESPPGSPPTKISLLRWQLDQCAQGIPPEMVYKLKGAGDPCYWPQYWTILRLNQIFGPHKWNTRLIKNERVGPPYTYKGSKGNVYAVAYECDLELIVTFADGIVKSCVGSGGDEGTSSKSNYGDIAAKARKSAFTDALKRAAMTLGPTFGAGLYDKTNPIRNGAQLMQDKPDRNQPRNDWWGWSPAEGPRGGFQNLAPLHVTSSEYKMEPPTMMAPPALAAPAPRPEAPPQGFVAAPQQAPPQQVPPAPQQAPTQGHSQPQGYAPSGPPTQYGPQQQEGPTTTAYTESGQPVQVPQGQPLNQAASLRRPQPPTGQRSTHIGDTPENPARTTAAQMAPPQQPQWQRPPQGPSDWWCQSCSTTFLNVFGAPDTAGAGVDNSCGNCGIVGSLQLLGPSHQQQQAPPVDPSTMHAPPVGSHGHGPVNGGHSSDRVAQARADMDRAMRNPSPEYADLIGAVDSAPVLNSAWTLDSVQRCLYQHGVDLNNFDNNRMPTPSLIGQLIQILAQPPAGQINP